MLATAEEIKNKEFEEYLEKCLQKKNAVTFAQDYYSMTTLAFYRENVEKLEIPVYK